MTKPIKFLALIMTLSSFVLTGCKSGETDHDTTRYDQDEFRKENRFKGATNARARRDTSQGSYKIGTTDTSAASTHRVQADTSDNKKR